ncbi:MAG TPA: hypothetical protein PK809_14910 [Bacteroidia bacterium]|nr:hypothetical protein [Bacteroidia bacterium]
MKKTDSNHRQGEQNLSNKKIVQIERNYRQEFSKLSEGYLSAQLEKYKNLIIIKEENDKKEDEI